MIKLLLTDLPKTDDGSENLANFDDGNAGDQNLPDIVGKSYECADCGKRYSQRSHLNHHARTAHVKSPNSKRIHSCRKCGQVFANSANFYRLVMLTSHVFVTRIIKGYTMKKTCYSFEVILNTIDLDNVIFSKVILAYRVRKKIRKILNAFCNFLANCSLNKSYSLDIQLSCCFQILSIS